MLTAQTGLVNYIADSTVDFKTVEAYSGQMKDAIKLTGKLPAAFPMFKKVVKPLGIKNHLFDILICTKSDSFDKKTSQNTNLQHASALLDYIEANLTFTESTKDFIIDRDQNPPEARLLMQDNKFTIVVITVHVITE